MFLQVSVPDINACQLSEGSDVLIWVVVEIDFNWLEVILIQQSENCLDGALLYVVFHLWLIHINHPEKLLRVVFEYLDKSHSLQIFQTLGSDPEWAVIPHIRWVEVNPLGLEQAGYDSPDVVFNHLKSPIKLVELTHQKETDNGNQNRYDYLIDVGHSFDYILENL